MRRFITLLAMIVISYSTTLGQVPNFLGISTDENLSTWKSGLIQKGFKIIPNKIKENFIICENTYFKGIYNGNECIIGFTYDIYSEEIIALAVNIICKNTDNLNYTFETNLNEFLKLYNKYKVKYEDNNVIFNYNEDNNDNPEIQITLSKRNESYKVGDIEISNACQIIFINLKKWGMLALLDAYGNLGSASVLGIEFGSNKSTVISKLRERFGYSNVTENNGIVEVDNPSLGGFNFKYATFEFQYDNGKTYLSYANFETFYKIGQESIAKSDRDYLISLMKPKYKNSIGNYINEDRFKCYKFGTNPKDMSKALGLIRLKRDTGVDGIKRLYLILSYGPINYVDPSTDF